MNCEICGVKITGVSMEIADNTMWVCPDGYTWEFDPDGYPTLEAKSGKLEAKHIPGRVSYYCQPCEHPIHKKQALEWKPKGKLACEPNGWIFTQPEPPIKPSVEEPNE